MIYCKFDKHTKKVYNKEKRCRKMRFILKAILWIVFFPIMCCIWLIQGLMGIK
jgi:hypothetical protein